MASYSSRKAFLQVFFLKSSLLNDRIIFEHEIH